MVFRTFSEFYTYYLKQHSNMTSRKLHFVGTCAVISLLILFFFTGQFVVLMAIPIFSYGSSFIGHLGFEKNRPLSLSYPYYSILGDFRMFWDILSGKISAF